MSKEVKKNQINISINLIKGDCGYLSQWYLVKIGSKSAEIRSDEIVNEKDQEQLENYHICCKTKEELSKKCISILSKYGKQIYERVTKPESRKTMWYDNL